MKPILGQEAICPDGLGRVTEIEYVGSQIKFIQVTTYVNDRSCHWDKDNIQLIKPGKMRKVS